MNDIRKSPGYRQWRNVVKRRDGNACRRCGFENNLQVHHIKPLDKYPPFALELDNGLTLCGNCHSLLKGKEETTDLRAFLGNDSKIDQQLKSIDGSFSAYLERKLKSGGQHVRDEAVTTLFSHQSEVQRVRDEAILTLFSHLKVYPNSLSQMLPPLVFVLESKHWDDESHTKREAVEWLKKAPAAMSEESTRVSGNSERVSGNSDSQLIIDLAPTPDEESTLTPEVISSVISKYEQRVEQRRIEQECVAEEERLRRETEEKRRISERQQDLKESKEKREDEMDTEDRKGCGMCLVIVIIIVVGWLGALIESC